MLVCAIAAGVVAGAAGNNGGQHLSYAQLETVAKHVVSKLK